MGTTTSCHSFRASSQRSRTKQRVVGRANVAAGARVARELVVVVARSAMRTGREQLELEEEEREQELEPESAAWVAAVQQPSTGQDQHYVPSSQIGRKEARAPWSQARRADRALAVA